MTAWDRDSPEAVVVVQQDRIKELEQEVEQQKLCAADAYKMLISGRAMIAKQILRAMFRDEPRERVH